MVEPYIEAVCFIGNNKDLLKKIKLVPEIEQKFEEKDLQEYIEEKISNIIFKYDINKKNEEEKSELYQKEPERIFNCVFTDLHKLFGGGKVSDDGFKSAEINNETALEIFKKFAEEDKTIISELYYGKKQISKHCKKCKMILYSYIYQRTIVLDLIDYKRDINLEDEINNLIIEEEKKEFCPFCSMDRKLKIIKKIKENPQNMIIVLKNNINNIRINFEKYMFDDEYELIGAEISEIIKTNKFCLFSKCSKASPKRYQFFSDNMLEMQFNDIKKQQPFVLYYKKTGKKVKKKNKIGKKLINKENIKSNEEFLDNNNNINISKKKKEKKLKNMIINDEDNLNNNYDGSLRSDGAIILRRSIS